MPVYKAPVDEVLFLLNDVFHIERYANLPGFADASPDVVAAILGVLKSGAGYLPLDPEHPRERLDFVLADAGAALIVTEQRLLERGPIGQQIFP